MEIREYTPFHADEILDLYTQVGWTAYTKNMQVLEHGFQHSLLVLGAYKEGNLCGIIRVVGDGHTVIFIQDVLVAPKWQRQGIGTALMNAVLDRYSDVRQIQLTTDNTAKTAAFYRSLGFRELSEIGCCGFMKC